MNKIEPDSGGQKRNYHLELPAQFTSWNQFYDELTRLAFIQPATTTIRIKVFQSAHTLKDGESLSLYLTYERQHIERMCLEELRKERSNQPSYLLTVQEVEQLIGIVSNQASRIGDWDLLVKLNELLRYKQQRDINQSNNHI
ncbi:hypothetical protein IC229_31420 [Spirosoma sp. BT702]|uniref:Uncharacterized protein n=1 Tax=Spirosoma profusum TaxID=2771354 RepID=A0A927GAE3_9BACT|nr:hypothetical protein [Spirosoma profusum]MBD2705174.1 hypothetical protein [Spirosoma profusum]